MACYMILLMVEYGKTPVLIWMLIFVRIHLYSDEFELCNPLGSSKGEHKICAFYFLVSNLETKYWSSLSNIHLAMLCKYKHVKSIGYKAILEPLLAD